MRTGRLLSLPLAAGDLHSLLPDEDGRRLYVAMKDNLVSTNLDDITQNPRKVHTDTRILYTHAQTRTHTHTQTGIQHAPRSSNLMELYSQQQCNYSPSFRHRCNDRFLTHLHCAITCPDLLRTRVCGEGGSHLVIPPLLNLSSFFRVETEAATDIHAGVQHHHCFKVDPKCQAKDTLHHKYT